MSIWENGKATEPMEKELICRIVERSIKAYGKMINNKDKDNNNGLMGLYIEDFIRKGKSMGKEYFTGETIVLLKESFMIIRYMVRESTFGKMEEFMMENGTIIECMVVEYLLGLMEGDMRDSI